MKNNKIVLMLIIGIILGCLVTLVLDRSLNKKEENPTKVTENNPSNPTNETTEFTIYIDSEATTKEIEEIKNNIKKLDITLENMTFKDKEKVRKEALAKLSPEEALNSELSKYTKENNPLEHELIITVKNVANKEDLKKKLTIFINVTSVKY